MNKQIEQDVIDYLIEKGVQVTCCDTCHSLPTGITTIIKFKGQDVAVCCAVALLAAAYKFDVGFTVDVEAIVDFEVDDDEVFFLDKDNQRIGKVLVEALVKPYLDSIKSKKLMNTINKVDANG